MSIHSRFLTFSIKEQICYIILILTIFSVLVILCLPCAFTFEILREDYKNKKRFFYNEYKEFLEACYYYQGYNLLKYEEIIKRMLKEAFKYSTIGGNFNYKQDYDSEYTEQYPVRDLDYEGNPEDENRTDILYFHCESDSYFKCLGIKESLQNKYESIYSLVFSTDANDRFRMPEIEIPLLDKGLSVNINDSFMFCFDKNIMKNILKVDVKKDLERALDFIVMNMKDYLEDRFFLYDRLFENAEADIGNKEIKDLFRDYEYFPQEKDAILYERAKEFSGYYSSIQFSNDISRLFSYNPETDVFYYLEMRMVREFILQVHKSLSVDLNVHFIPLFSQNDTLLLPEICFFMMLKQTNEIFTKEKIEENVKKIQAGKSKIDECFYDKKNYEEQKIIKEIFEKGEAPFLDIKNIIRKGIYKLPDGTPWYFMRYSFPNINILKDFKSDHLILDSLNFYLISSFKEPKEYADYIWAQHKNLFYLIVILILYIWIICLVVNMIIFYKLIKQITQPIYRLQEAINSNDTKDESIFKYEYDDIINELFITCKELITRKIDTRNTSKYSSQFNILNSEKDKNNNIDKRKYEKNLIINNEIMNQLINEQQNMNDLSKNIDVNKELDTNLGGVNEKSKIKLKGGIKKDGKKDKEKKNIHFANINNQNKNEEEKDKECYKSLFKLAEYLYFYRNKNEENLVSVNGNLDEESRKSIYSKMKKKLSKIQTFENNLNEKNITINVLKDKDITYMWYMEMKRRKNKSFDYHISDDYEELFRDVVDNE